MSNKGTFVVSLDFELYWGMFDKVTLKQYGENIRGVHTALPRILTLFETYGIHATWATVGMLMCEDQDELTSLLPHESLRPVYNDMRVSAYEYLSQNKTLESHYYFGKHLVEKITKTPHQELASHTFSHYYTIDGAKNSSAVFRADCEAFTKAAKRFGTKITSIVFPRNQVTAEALEVCTQQGFTAYRGTPDHFLYTGKAEAKQTNLVLRSLRFLDTYLNLSGHHTYKRPQDHRADSRYDSANLSVNRKFAQSGDSTIHHTNSSVNRATPSTPNSLINVPGSWFLRPYSHTLRFLEWMKLRRIKNAMTYAAKNGEIYHLWWHPHNFGKNQDQNFKNLTETLEHFTYLQKEYGMESRNMNELSHTK